MADADAVDCPLSFDAREPEIACAIAALPHAFVAMARLLEAALTNALPCPRDSAKLAAFASALPSALQHLSPAWAMASLAARLSAEFMPAANASERTSAVVSALGELQMQSKKNSGVLVLDVVLVPARPLSTDELEAPWPDEDGGVKLNQEGKLELKAQLSD